MNNVLLKIQSCKTGYEEEIGTKKQKRDRAEREREENVKNRRERKKERCRTER